MNELLGRRGRIVCSALVLFGLTAACGAGAEEENAAAGALDEAEEQEPVETTPEAPATPPAAIAQAIRGCWDGPIGFYECFNEGGAYIYSEGTPQPGTYRLPAANRLEITNGAGSVTTWTVVVDELELALTGQDGNTIRYIRRPADGVPATPDRMIGCWRRTTGGATECYSADHTWATRRTTGLATTGASSTTGTWRFLSPVRLELIILGEPNIYGMAWSGTDRVTFIASDAREVFVRVAAVPSAGTPNP